MKRVSLPYGHKILEISVPDFADVLSVQQATPLADVEIAVRKSLENPISSKPLSLLAKGCENAAIVVSDNTRPVPYKGEGGILMPILRVLRESGVGKVKIIIATGTHRPMKEPEIRDMLGDVVFTDGYEVINHVSTDASALRRIGKTEMTPSVTVNRHYLDAQLKIATGLVEPHCMAGFSGGRKAICPGVCAPNSSTRP